MTGVRIVILLLCASSAVHVSCGGAVGQCVASSGSVDSCKVDWTRDECAEWDDMEVNGASWSWTRDSCGSRGFTVECPDGTFLRPEQADLC